MGDFERTFGAGADACSIIDGYSRSALSLREDIWTAVKKPSDRRETPYDRSGGKEIYFSSFEEMKAWDEKNPKCEYVRRPQGAGFIMKLLER